MTPREFAGFLREAFQRRGLESAIDYVVFGSSVMRLHGLRDQVSDVDVFVTAPRWAMLRRHPEWIELRPREDDPPLLETVYQGVEIHAFYAWTSRDKWICAAEAFIQRGIVDGIPCIPLAMVAFHKQSCLDIVGEWPCETCRGADEWGCEACHGTGRFQAEGSRYEKHEHDLRIIGEHVTDLPAKLDEQAVLHGARPALEVVGV